MTRAKLARLCSNRWDRPTVSEYVERHQAKHPASSTTLRSLQPCMATDKLRHILEWHFKIHYKIESHFCLYLKLLTHLQALHFVKQPATSYEIKKNNKYSTLVTEAVSCDTARVRTTQCVPVRVHFEATSDLSPNMHSSSSPTKAGLPSSHHANSAWARAEGLWPFRRNFHPKLTST